jgi:predicted hotdog family 3-hydroxylacyl-ACP dehydratase
MLVSKEQILSLLPQRPPIVMVDELIYTDETTTRCSFTVLPTNIFADNGVFGEPGLVENIAQTAAAGVGYRAGKTKEPVPVGYIGAIKDLRIFNLPKIGDTIVTEVSVVNKVFDVTLVNGSIYCNEELAATCEMKIFISKQS